MITSGWWRDPVTAALMPFTLDACCTNRFAFFRNPSSVDPLSPAGSLWYSRHNASLIRVATVCALRGLFRFHRLPSHP